MFLRDPREQKKTQTPPPGRERERDQLTPLPHRFLDEQRQRRACQALASVPFQKRWVPMVKRLRPR